MKREGKEKGKEIGIRKEERENGKEKRGNGNEEEKIEIEKEKLEGIYMET